MKDSISSSSDLNIRMAKASDAKQIQKIYSHYVLNTAITFEVDIPSVKEMIDRVNKTLEMFPWIVIEKQNHICGYAYAGPHRTRQAYQWCAETSIYLSPQFIGMNIGSILYIELFRLLRKQNFINLYAGISLPNPISHRFHLKMGFQEIGKYPSIGHKRGKWHDVIWFYQQLQEFQTPPKKIIPISNII